MTSKKVTVAAAHHFGVTEHCNGIQTDFPYTKWREEDAFNGRTNLKDVREEERY